MRDLSIRLLRAFHVLAQEGQFRTAAERFHVTQSAFSQMIARLEDQVGARLFDRTPRGACLTPQGKLLLPLAADIVERVEAAFRKMRCQDEASNGSIAISAIPSLTAEWLPSILARFKSMRPNTKVRLLDLAEPSRSLSMLREGHLDFTIAPEDTYSQDIEADPLFEELFYLVCNRKDRLAEQTDAHLRDISGCSFLHLRRNSSIDRMLTPLLEAVAVVDSGFVAENHDTVAGLVANGFGVSVVPASALPHYRHPDHVVLPLRDPQLRRRMFLLKRRGEPLSNASRDLRELIVESPPLHSRALDTPIEATARPHALQSARTAQLLQ